MRVPKLRLAVLAAVSGIALSGCAYDMYGDPYGYGGYGGGYGGYSPYGYSYPRSGVSIGVGYGGGYNPYYSNYGYGGYGSYYGGSPFGWYDDFYYPGSGIYVYDSYRRPRVWSDTQRLYWSDRNSSWRNNSRSTWTRDRSQQNWSGFDRHRATGITIRGQKYYDERTSR